MVGLKVVGSAGDDKKIKYLKEELAFDEAFNYHTEKPADALPKLCPDGIGTPPLFQYLMEDIYWENVGGETLDAVLDNANNFARIVGCGMISQNGQKEPYGVKNLMYIVSKRIRFEGFIQGDLREKYWTVCFLLMKTDDRILRGIWKSLWGRRKLRLKRM
jgi:NADPH-dependent curcumin reductase CurA